MPIRNFFLKVGFLDLNEKRMNQLIQKSDEKMILWAFENGVYNIRRAAVQYFTSTKSSKSISVLHKAMHDKTEVISQEAMLGLEKLGASSEIIQEIYVKRKFWVNENAYREARRNRERRKESVLAVSKERGSKKSLDNARNMLKKPMIGGKWF